MLSLRPVPVAHKALAARQCVPCIAAPKLHCSLPSRRTTSSRPILCSAQSDAHPAVKPNPLNLLIPLGIAVPLAALKLVPPPSIAFCFAWSIYLALVNYWRFNGNTAFKGVRSALFFKPWVKTYANLAGVFSVIIPLVLICLPGQAPAVRQMLAPHLFLVASQIVMEYISYSLSWAILPRMLVPIGFNTARLFTIADWLQQAPAFGLGHTAFAAATGVLWTYNLFGFLLLTMVPVYLDPKSSPP